MKTIAAAISARHSHLVRASRSAGEVFAYPGAEESDPGRERSRALAALCIGAGALATLGFYFIF